MDDFDCSPNILGNDDTTTEEDTTTNATFTTSSSSSSSGFLDSSVQEESCSSSQAATTSEDNGNEDIFPIMQLPTEIRSRIFNMLPQRQVPCLRLVSKNWRLEMDHHYEFCLNIYDTTTNLPNIRKLRCKECTIWKLTTKLDKVQVNDCGESTFSLFAHPAYLKVIKVYGPVSSENLSNLITASFNLEHLTLTRRANYPYALNLIDTPGLANLTELRYLRLNSEEHISIHSRTSSPSGSKLPVPPMMDCYFPKLKHFEILKRFAVWQYSHYVTSILKFIARHWKTLRNIELDLIPLSCIALLNNQSDSEDSDFSSASSDEDDEDDLENRHQYRPHKMKKNSSSAISTDLISLSDLVNLRLHKFCVTTKGADCDIPVWKAILESQSELTELRFDWLCRDPRVEMLARVTGFPWVHFQIPVESSCETLVHVELASLSMFAPDSTERSRRRRRVLPFDLAIFRNCKRLKSLILRCRENHAKLTPRDLANNIVEVDVADPAPVIPVCPSSSSEVLLMINGIDLPNSIEQLEIFRFPMLTSDLVGMVSQTLPNIRKLFLHECGKTGEFGVDESVLQGMAKTLTKLKFLEIIGFNDRGGEKRSQLEKAFQTIGPLPYEGPDTWLEFSDGSSSAHESLKSLLSPAIE